MGIVLYGTCDFTNAALLKHWPWAVALLDLAWGTLASGLLALVQVSWATDSATVSCGCVCVQQ